MIRLGHSKRTPSIREIYSDQYVVKTVQILGKRRSGKSYCASKIAEDLLTDKVPIVIIDPMNAYWGLKEKFDIIILGKEGDEGIDATFGLSGEVNPKVIQEQAWKLASNVADSDASLILNLSSFGNRFKQYFAGAFLDTLFQNNKIRRHIFIEEADIFASQRPTNPAQFECLDAVDNAVRRGGQKGLGVTIITQRPQLVSKNILSQADLTLVFNVQAPQDLKAVMDIIADEDTPKDAIKKLRTEIKRYPPGQCLLYSPEWLHDKDLIKISEKQTYHAGETLGQSARSKREFVIKRSEELRGIVNKLLVHKPKLEGNTAGRDYVHDKIYTNVNESTKDEQPVLSINAGSLVERKKIEMPNRGLPGYKIFFEDPPGIHHICKTHVDWLEEQLRIANSNCDMLLNEWDKSKERVKYQSEMIESQQKQLADFEGLKSALHRIFQLTPAITSKDAVLTSTDAKVGIQTKIHSMTFSDEDLEGRLLWIIAFEPQYINSKSIVDIHKFIQNRFSIPASEYIGKPNAGRFRSKLKDVLDRFSKRPYDFLQKNEKYPDLYEVRYQESENRITVQHGQGKNFSTIEAKSK